MDLFNFDPPDLDDETVARLAADWYGVTGELQRLRGERSHNTRITAEDGRDYVLRVASDSEDPATIDFQVGALTHLERHAPDLPIARVIVSRTGRLLPRVELDGRCHAMRLETFLPGMTFDDDQPISLTGFDAIGSLVGRVSVALSNYHHPASTNFMPWDIANGLVLDSDLRPGLGADARPLVERAQRRLESAAAAMAVLPRQVIHNDGHGGNLLRANDESDVVTGMIDFGDLVHTVTVADLAVSGSNLVPHQRDPIASLAALTAGYHVHRALSDAEIDALPDLVLSRLVLSTLLVDYQIAHAPHIASAVASERPGLLADLERWLAIEPAHVAEHVSAHL